MDMKNRQPRCSKWMDTFQTVHGILRIYSNSPSVDYWFLLITAHTCSRFLWLLFVESHLKSGLHSKDSLSSWYWHVICFIMLFLSGLWSLNHPWKLSQSFKQFFVWQKWASFMLNLIHIQMNVIATQKTSSLKLHFPYQLSDHIKENLFMNAE